MSDRRLIKMPRCKKCKKPVYVQRGRLFHAPSYPCQNPELEDHV